MIEPRTCGGPATDPWGNGVWLLHLTVGILALNLAVFVAPRHCAADEMISLIDWLALSETSTEPTYLPTRCAGLYYAIVKRAGANQMDKSEFTYYSKSIAQFQLVASVQHSKRYEVALEVAGEVIQRRTKIFMERYYDRTERNFVETGEAFGAMIKSDVPICQSLLRITGESSKR